MKIFNSIPEQQLRVLESILAEIQAGHKTLHLSLNKILDELEEQTAAIQKQTPILLGILDALTSGSSETPLTVTFQETSMLPPVAGNTLVYTGTLNPAGSAYPAGTTFSLISSDPTVTPTVDATGLIVTIPLPDTFVDDPANPFNVRYLSSTFVPVPDTSPAAVSATITPSIPTPTPLGITFVQTT